VWRIDSDPKRHVLSLSCTVLLRKLRYRQVPMPGPSIGLVQGHLCSLTSEPGSLATALNWSPDPKVKCKERQEDSIFPRRTGKGFMEERV
jgi:hypothetical protein